MELLEFLLGVDVAAPQTLIEELYGHVRMMQQRLVEKRHEDRIASARRHALQGLVGGLPADAGQPLCPVGIEAGEVPAMDAGVPQEGDLAQGGEDLRSRMGDGFLSQPAQRCLPRRRVGFQEAVEEVLALALQQRRQAAKGLVMGLLAGRCDEALQACHARPENLFAVEFLARQLQ